MAGRRRCVPRCGLFGYAALVVLLRASGQRMLSKVNAFKFFAMVALGAALATVTLSKVWQVVLFLSLTLGKTVPRQPPGPLYPGEFSARCIGGDVAEDLAAHTDVPLRLVRRTQPCPGEDSGPP